jgi:hypothetical protein
MVEWCCLHLVNGTKSGCRCVYGGQRMTQLREQTLEDFAANLKLIVQAVSKDAASQPSEPILRS